MVKKNLTSKLSQVYAQLPYLPQAFTLVWAAARRWTIAWAVMLVLQGLLPVATVYLTRALVDSLVASVEAGGGWQALRTTADKRRTRYYDWLLTEPHSIFGGRRCSMHSHRKGEVVEK